MSQVNHRGLHQGWGKAGCDRVAATQPRVHWVLQFFHNPPNSDTDYGIYDVRTGVNACPCTRGCTDTVRVCTESWLPEKKTPLPHRGIEHASTACRSDALPTKPHPHPWAAAQKQLGYALCPEQRLKINKAIRYALSNGSKSTRLYAMPWATAQNQQGYPLCTEQRLKINKAFRYALSNGSKTIRLYAMHWATAQNRSKKVLLLHKHRWNKYMKPINGNICTFPTYLGQHFIFILSPVNNIRHQTSHVPRSGELRTQKLKSHLVRTQSLNVLPLKPGVGQNIAIHATLTARDFFLAYFYTSGPFTCIFSKTSPDFPLCWLWLTHGSCVGPQNKIGHPAGCRFLCWVPAEYK